MTIDVKKHHVVDKTFLVHFIGESRSLSSNLLGRRF